MPWIREATVSDARNDIIEGARLVRRYWPDDAPAHSHLSSFITAQAVSFDAEGRVTITTHVYAESGGRTAPTNLDLYYAPDDVVAIAAMTDMRPGVQTYANHDDRLILPGGYLAAHPGTMHYMWDAFKGDGTPIAQGVTTADGRAMLAEYAPEMIWVHHGDGKWTARGYGRAWKIERGRRNPDFTAHTPLSQAWLYDLLTRPLDVEEWETLRADLATPEEAKGAAPAPQHERPTREVTYDRDDESGETTLIATYVVPAEAYRDDMTEAEAEAACVTYPPSVRRAQADD